MKKLNLGAGEDIRKGYVNIDFVNVPGMDIVHNLEDLPLPFKDNEFDEVFCQDVFEHIDYVPLMKEIYRIMKPGAILKLRIPHFSSPYVYIDPTHIKGFSFETMSFFTETNRWNTFYFDYKFKRIISTRLDFDKCPLIFWNYLIEPLVNCCEKFKRIYERTFLKSLFPCSNIYVEIER